MSKTMLHQISLFTGNVITRAFSSALHHCIMDALGRFWRALKKQELLLTAPQATLMFFLCAPNFVHALSLHDAH